MAMVSMTVRIEERIKEGLRELAEREGRSMAGYLEWMIEREGEAMKGGSVTLERIDKKLDTLLNFISESKKKPCKEKVNTNEEKKLTAYDAWEDCGVCTKENWERWINHLHACNIHVNHYRAGKYFETLTKINNDEWDCDDVIDYVITAGHCTFYVPEEWRKKASRR